ncbi:MAG: sn-glycerol-3-phosphate ABC transporter permease UgpA [Inquilinus sp.]|nr:sn-glycerol-3-phosphate ABC transporter permease UgpA [Inquilinus sp.]
MNKRVTFDNRVLPYLLVTPQIVITVVFFLWPAGQAVWQSLLRQNPFGTSVRFVWFQNFEKLIGDEIYYDAILVTFEFGLLVAFASMAIALFLAVMADRVIKAATAYKTLLIWPYAVAPAVAGVLWLFMFAPTVGIVAYALDSFGYLWNFRVNGGEAMALVVFAATWKQISYNFLFFLAGLQSIPRSLIEAAAIDGAGPTRRFWTIVFPLLSPTTFFLLVVNIVYAFFDTFGIIHAVTAGGPYNATTTMVYKVFNDGFIGQDLGSSAAQSVVLMVIVVTLTVVQFRFIERRVHY